MDRAIGRVTSYLREIGELDSGFLKGRSLLIPLDTMVVFMSDNGAEGAAYEGGFSALHRKNNDNDSAQQCRSLAKSCCESSTVTMTILSTTSVTTTRKPLGVSRASYGVECNRRQVRVVRPSMGASRHGSP
jgi:hypothetical protein